MLHIETYTEEGTAVIPIAEPCLKSLIFIRDNITPNVYQQQF